MIINIGKQKINPLIKDKINYITEIGKNFSNMTNYKHKNTLCVMYKNNKLFKHIKNTDNFKDCIDTKIIKLNLLKTNHIAKCNNRNNILQKLENNYHKLQHKFKLNENKKNININNNKYKKLLNIDKCFSKLILLFNEKTI